MDFHNGQGNVSTQKTQVRLRPPEGYAGTNYVNELASVLNRMNDIGNAGNNPPRPTIPQCILVKCIEHGGNAGSQTLKSTFVYNVVDLFDTSKIYLIDAAPQWARSIGRVAPANIGWFFPFYYSAEYPKGALIQCDEEYLTGECEPPI